MANKYMKKYSSSLAIEEEQIGLPNNPCCYTCKSTYGRDVCTPMLIAALFTRAKLWSHTRCPTTDD
jgi:hypothetical protein